MLTGALVAAALLAGLAGAWSPCGLSMVETLAAGRRAVVALGSVAFAAGALAGAVVTFGGLALAGEALGAGGGVAVAVACAALLVAAAGGQRLDHREPARRPRAGQPGEQRRGDDRPGQHGTLVW